MERMSWVMELFDKMSGPAKRMNAQLKNLYATMGSFRKPLQTFAKDQDLAGSAAMTLGGTLGMLTKGALIAGAAFVALGFFVGKSAFENFAFKESALATGRALWGSAEAADAMFKKASQLARLTPFNVKEVATAFNRLGAAGFGMEEVPVVFQGLSDIASMSGKGTEAISGMTLAFSQIMGKGKLMSQELNQITESAGGAVSRMKLFGEIAKIMGVSEKSIESMMENGLIPARVAIMGVMQVAKGLGGGVIGQNSIEQSKTLGGLWSNLEDTITNLWLTMDLTRAPWFTAVKSFLSGLIDALDTTSHSGQVLQGVMDRLFSKTIGSFIGDGTQDMGQIISDLALGFEFAANVGIAAFKGLWEGLKKGFAPMLAAMGEMRTDEDVFRGVQRVFEAIGVAVAQIANGLIVIGGLVAKITGQADGSKSPFAMDPKDPTKAMSAFAAGPFAALMPDFNKPALPGERRLGFMGGWPSKEEVDPMAAARAKIRAMDSNVAPESNGALQSFEPTPGSGGGTGAGGRTNVTLSVNVNNNGHEDGDSIAQRLGEMLPSTIAGIFDQLAAERGLAT